MKNEAYVVVDRIQKCYLNMNIKVVSSSERKTKVKVKYSRQMMLWIVE